MKHTRLLSIVVPSYKQERTIQKNLTTIITTLSKIGISYEIIVVVDGRVDKTFKNAMKVKNKNLHIYQYEVNQGKGHAVKYGMLKAKGDIVGFLDAGNEIDPISISMLLNHMDWYDADIIVGSKLHPVSQVEYPFARVILSWGYRTFTRILFGFAIRDTQVGLKLFKKKVIHDVFPRLQVKKFAFDIEILAVSYALGYKRIYEAPVRLNFKESSISSKNFWKIIAYMLWDTSGVYYRLKKNQYAKIQK